MYGGIDVEQAGQFPPDFASTLVLASTDLPEGKSSLLPGSIRYPAGRFQKSVNPK